MDFFGTSTEATGGDNGRNKRPQEPPVIQRPQRRLESSSATEKTTKGANGFSAESSLIVGAKTMAGVGIGLLTVVAAVTAVGIAAEGLLVPSLLLKFAGGIAGGGMGMAKGLNDERKLR